MKRILFIALLFCIKQTKAQDSTQVITQKNKRVFIGVNFSPDYCSGIFKDPVVNTLGLKAIPKFGYTSGINIFCIITKHLSIETGVQYSKKEFDVKTDLTFGDRIDRRRGFVYNTGENNANIYNYLDIPLKANFTFGKKRIRFISSIGVTTNLFLNATSYSFFVGNNNNRINLSPTISCGIDFKIKNRMCLRIEPTLRYGILKVSNDLATLYIWNAGLNISYYFGVRK
ncbi:MAG: hypothetical protein ACYDCN_06785 [Bacteroidia bacterium]